MKLYCQYSGVSFALPHFAAAQPAAHPHSQSNGKAVCTKHPIFDAPLSYLSQLVDAWKQGRIEHENDRRLLFLAIFNASNHVEWRYTARPSDATVQLHMDGLWSTVQWLQTSLPPALKLPFFVVSRDTASLSNIGVWINIWNEKRSAFQNGYRTISEERAQRERELSLEKYIRGYGSDDTHAYVGILAQWALEAADVPKHLREDWKRIICTKGLELLNIPLEKLIEIQNFMAESLAEFGSLQSHTILAHLARLERYVRTGQGFSGSIGGRLDLDLVDIATRSSYEIVPEDQDEQSVSIQRVINSAPAHEPVLAHYSSRTAYLRAKIAWQWKQRSEAIKRSFETQVAATLQQDSIDNLDNSIDNSLDEGEAA